MPGNDLIGPKQAPSGDIVGLDLRAGDLFFISGTGPVFLGSDGNYYRLTVDVIDGLVQFTANQVVLT